MKTPIELIQAMTDHEDAESAVAIYKEAALAIEQYEQVKRLCLDLAEACLRQTGEVALKTLVGSCGWTQPKTPQLNKAAWAAAIEADHNLNAYQLQYNLAEKHLHKAQEPYTELPAGRFFIR